MKMKKILALLLASVMVLALLAGCGGGNNDTPTTPGDDSSSTDTNTPSDTNTTTPPADDGSVPTITWYMVGGGQPSNIDSWTQTANAYLEEKIGVHINIQCVSWGDWGDQRSMVIQTNEPYDIMFTDSGSYASDVAMGAFADITDLLAQTPGITDLIPQEYLDACKINGRLYGIPAYKDTAMANFFVWTKEYVDNYYPDYANIHTLADATPAVTAIKEGTGEPPLLLNKDGISCVVGQRYDQLGMGGMGAIGVSYYDPDGKVVCTFEQQDVLDQLNVLYDWMKNGMINSDAATASEATGMCGVGISQGWPSAAKGWGECRGAEVVVSQFGDIVVSTDTIQGSMACISSSSSHQLEALKVIELVSTDTKFRDMLYYGEEGVNFEYVDEDGVQKVSKLNNDWTLAGYTQGTFKTVTPVVGTAPYFDEVDEQNRNAISSVAMGFVFDKTPVADQIAACQAIFEGYKGLIQTGTGEPESTVAQMMSEMRASGFDDIVAEAQAQLDAYLGK